jgi:spore coat polysaccharide biosynthesis protein SpsF
MKTTAIIEARMGSSRLPGKVLMEIGGMPALQLLCNRLKACKKVDDVVIATSVSDGDKAIEDFGKANGIRVYRGSEDDVLGRVVGAAEFAETEVIVEITGDCPLMDPEVVDYVTGYFLYKYPEYDYVTNIGYVGDEKREIPIGMDVRVFTYKDLKHISEITSDPEDREHVSLYFFRTGKDKYKLQNLPTPSEWKRDYNVRIALDTEEDLNFIRKLYDSLSVSNEFFGLKEILEYTDKHRELLSLNAEVVQKKVKGID